MALLTAWPYPFHEPLAQELLKVLTRMYPSGKGAMAIALDAGFNPGRINSEQQPDMVWREVLTEGASAQLNRALVEKVRDQNPRHPQREFLEKLLADQPVALDPEPASSNGTPRFITGGDDVTQQEALLYHDDLTISVARVAWLTELLGRLVKLAPAVCLLEVDFNGRAARGTGFRVGKDLLLTNWHVLFHNNARATSVTAQFGFEDGQTPRAVACDVASIVADEADDWGVLRATTPLDDAWPVIPLADEVPPVVNEPAFIIQHPGGNRKRLGFVRNQVTSFDDRVVHYLTDTQTGSSGSPVFNERCELIALHHVGGRPQEVPGRAPLKKNEGVRISRVAAGLAKANIALP